MRYSGLLFGLLAGLLCLPGSGAALEAGVASADITPPPGGHMAGYGARMIPVSTGTHDPLFARALVLTDGEDMLALVTLDLVGFPADSVREVKAAIEEKTGIAQVMLAASHTHSGPEAGERTFPSDEAPWIETAEQTVVSLVKEAQSACQPVRYGAGKGRVEEGHNRRKVSRDGEVTMFWRNEAREPTEPVDYELGVIRFDTLDGNTLATLVNFTCHPVVLGPKNLEFSADYPGVMRTVVEERLGGMCLFANGACGDINPFLDKSDPAEGAFEEVARMGRAVGEEAVQVAEALTMNETADPDLTVRTKSIALDMRWDIEDPEVIAALEKKYGKILVHVALERFKAQLPLAGGLVTVTLGDDVAIAGVPGEFFVEHGLWLKEQCVIPNTFVFGYCNGSLAYFPTINAAHEGGYGGKEATIVEVGAGERFMREALISFYYQTGRLRAIPAF